MQAFGLQLEILKLMQSQKFSENLEMTAFKLRFFSLSVWTKQHTPWTQSEGLDPSLASDLSCKNGLQILVVIYIWTKAPLISYASNSQFLF